MLINRGKGICAVALAIGAGSVGVGFATFGPASASADHGHGHGNSGNASWHASSGAPPGWSHSQGWHGNGHSHSRWSGAGNGQPSLGAPAPQHAPAQPPTRPSRPATAGNSGHQPPGHGGTPPGLASHGGTPPGLASHGGTPPGQARHAARSSSQSPSAVQPQGLGNQGHTGQGSDQGHGGGDRSQLGACTSCKQNPQSLISAQNPGSVTIGPATGNSSQNSLPTTPGSTTGGSHGGGGSNPGSTVGRSTSNVISTTSIPVTSHTTGPALTTPPLGPGIIVAPAAGATGAGTGTTAGLLHTGAQSAATAAVAARTAASVARRPVHRVVPNPSSGPSVFTRIERVVPGFVWLALAAALAMVAVGGTATLLAGRRVRRQAGQFAAVSAAAMTDPLTGVLNRRGFLEALERELARARRYGLMFTLAYVDLRNLKGVNDTEGHLAGDEVLKNAAGLLKESARADDVVGRIGGDEMGLLLVEQGPDGADTVIRRITSQIPERRAALGLTAPWDLTVGTASFPQDGSTANELLATADRRLYEQRGIALR